MKPDLHQAFRTMIDEVVVAGSSTPPPATLRLHLESCEACRRYLDNTSRVIASLSTYSFAIDSSHNATVFGALQRSAERTQAATFGARQAHTFNPGQLAWACVLAVLFTAAGSLVDIEFGSILAVHLPLHASQLRESIRALWLLTSLGSLLLFPLLPFLSRPRASRNPLSSP